MAVDDGMNYVTLRQIVNDFVITTDADDFMSHVSDAAIRNVALRGIREFGFDVTARVKSLKRTINSSNNTITLPDDYVDLIKVGVVGDDGVVHILGENKNLNYSRRLQTSDDTELDDLGQTGASLTSVFNNGPLPIEANEVADRVDDKTRTAGS